MNPFTAMQRAQRSLISAFVDSARDEWLCGANDVTESEEFCRGVFRGGGRKQLICKIYP